LRSLERGTAKYKQIPLNTSIQTKHKYTEVGGFIRFGADLFEVAEFVSKNSRWPILKAPKISPFKMGFDRRTFQTVPPALSQPL
jgi:hypothetical protein